MAIRPPLTEKRDTLPRKQSRQADSKQNANCARVIRWTGGRAISAPVMAPRHTPLAISHTGFILVQGARIIGGLIVRFNQISGVSRNEMHTYGALVPGIARSKQLPYIVAEAFKTLDSRLYGA